MQGADSENSPLPFSLPFALNRKNIFLIRLKAKRPHLFISVPKRKSIALFRLKIIDRAFVVDERFARKRDEPYIPRLTLG